MFKSTRDKIVKAVIEELTSTPDHIWSVIEDVVADTDDDRLKKFEARLDVIKALRVSRELERVVDELNEKELEMEHSSTPWMDYAVIGYDAEQGWKIRLGWNAAFIKKLKEAGIAGKNEEEMCHQYLAFINNRAIMKDYE